MSGPLSTILDNIARLSAARAEARVRNHVRRIAQSVGAGRVRHHPPPRDFGDFDAARAMLRGELRVGPWRGPLRDITPWDIELPNPALTAILHRFDWLDDMAALSGKKARARAQSWSLGWLDRYGDGSGPGWGIEVSALRLMRLLTHLPFLSKGLPEEHVARLVDTLPIHTAYLLDLWTGETDDCPRFRALAGAIHGALCLEGFEDRRDGLIAALGRECQARITDQGGIPSRSPEDLLHVFRHLIWLRALLDETGHAAPPELGDAIARIAPALRGLRHGDGTLARFHGGGPGPEGALDHALGDSGIRRKPTDKPPMGFARLTGGRVVVIVDCARPPEASDRAHASTLAFEMSSGRRPIFVNVGPPPPHLPEWYRMPRTTSAQNALAIDKTSSSRFGPPRVSGKPGLDRLQTRPSMVTLARARDETGMWIQTRHDGYLEGYGLIHERRIFVGVNGREVHGEDVLLAPDQKAKRRFTQRIKGAERLGISLSVHFHLHPDVEAETVRETGNVRILVGSGEVWTFRHDGDLADLESSAYLDPALPEPRAARQIVIRSRTLTHAAEINWSLIREDRPQRSLRDFWRPARDETGH